MKKKGIKHSIKNYSQLFYKYLLSYFFVFMLPFSILSFSWYSTTKNNLDHQLESANENNLWQVQNSITQHLQQLEHLANRITYDSDFSSHMDATGYSGIEIKSNLLKYKLNSSIVSEIYLTFHKNPHFLYSASGTYGIQTLLDKYDANDAKVEELLMTNIPLLFMTNDEETQTNETLRSNEVLFFVPITSGGASYGTVIYALDMNVIRTEISVILENSNGAVLLVDNQNNLMTSVDNDNILPELNKSTLFENADQNSLRVKGRTYYVNYDENPYGYFQILSLIYTPLLSSSLSQFLWTFFLGIVIAFILGAISTYIVANKQYKSIKKLEKMLSDKELVNERYSYDKQAYNELTILEEGIKNFLERSKKLVEQTDFQVPYVRRQLLRELLDGKLKDTSKANVLFETINMDLNKENFIVMYIDTKRKQDVLSEYNDNVMESLSVLQAENYVAYATELFNDPTKDPSIVYVINYDSNFKPSFDERNIIEDILQKIEIAMDSKFVSFVGSSYTGINRINQSYIESLVARDSYIFTKNKYVIYFDDIKNNTKKQGSKPFFSKEQELKFISSLQQGDMEVAIESLDAMLRDIEETDQGPNNSKIRLSYLIYMILRIGDENGMEEIGSMLNEINNFKLTENLKVYLYQVVREICKFINLEKDKKRNALRSQIFEYIESNFDSHEISLDSMANIFGFSVSYLSTFIKEEKGMTFSKYIQDLRIGKIKRELIDTNYLIKDIIQNAGYYDVPNFTRKFKEIEGITPSQFRKKSR